MEKGKKCTYLRAEVEANGNSQPQPELCKEIDLRLRQGTLSCMHVCAFALHMPRKLFQNQNSFFLSFSSPLRSLKRKTASSGFTNTLGSLIHLSCVNATAVMNHHFSIIGVEHSSWVNFILANEYIPVLLEMAEPDCGDPEVNG